jgi:hypothetical protein
MRCGGVVVVTIITPTVCNATKLCHIIQPQFVPVTTGGFPAKEIISYHIQSAPKKCMHNFDAHKSHINRDRVIV